jgi:hypothetical protein
MSFEEKTVLNFNTLQARMQCFKSFAKWPNSMILALFWNALLRLEIKLVLDFKTFSSLASGFYKLLRIFIKDLVSNSSRCLLSLHLVKYKLFIDHDSIKQCFFAE